MIDLEGGMHQFADNPEPEEVVLTTCRYCDCNICVGEKVAKSVEGIMENEGLMHEECFTEVMEEWCNQRIFSAEHDTVTDGN